MTRGLGLTVPLVLLAVSARPACAEEANGLRFETAILPGEPPAEIQLLWKPEARPRRPAILLAGALKAAEPPAWSPGLLEEGFLLAALSVSHPPDPDAARRPVWLLFDERFAHSYALGASRAARDAGRAIDFLAARADVDADNIGWLGTSTTGIFGLAAAAREPRIRAVVAFVATGALRDWFRTWNENGLWRGGSSGLWPETERLLDTDDPILFARNLSPRAVLLVSGGEDKVVDARSARVFFEAARPAYKQEPERLRFVVHEGIGHNLPPDVVRMHAEHWFRLHLRADRAPSSGPAAPARAAAARGFSIPLVDLSPEEDRRTIVDREAGQYLGHPSTVLLEDGKTIITVYPKGHGKGAIVMKRSPDGGRTWSDRLPVPANWSTSLETPTIHRVVDREGVKRLILFSGLHPCRSAVSEDDGATWTPLEPVGDWGGIVTMGSVAALRGKPGTYLAMFHDDGRFFTAGGRVEKPVVFTLYQSISEDGGRSWPRPEAVLRRSDVHLCEPGVIRSPDGGELCALLRENSRKRNSHAIFSRDEARTWSEPTELPGALTGDRHTAKYAPDGRLFISFRDTTLESATRGDWVAWVGRYEDIAAGREGQVRVRLLKNHNGQDCAYPGVEVLPDGTIVAVTYGHWTAGEKPYIVCVRLKLEEIDARMGGK